MRLPRLPIFGVFACGIIVVGTTAFEDRIAPSSHPLDGDLMALSPDGTRVAFTSHVRGQLRVAIVAVEPPGPRRSVVVTREPGAEGPTRLRFLRWATNDRLIFAPEERAVPLLPVNGAGGAASLTLDGPSIRAPICATDAEGRQVVTLVDARDFQETPANALRSPGDFLRTPQQLAASRNGSLRLRIPHLDVLGFLPRQREQLIIRTHGAYSMPTLHMVDTSTGEVRDFTGNWMAPPGESQVFDWFRLKVVGERLPGAPPRTTWHDADLAKVQHELEAKFPRRVVEIVDWNESHTRVVFRVGGSRDFGRGFVFQRTEDVVLEIMRRAPWLNAAGVQIRGARD